MNKETNEKQKLRVNEQGKNNTQKTKKIYVKEENDSEESKNK